MARKSKNRRPPPPIPSDGLKVRAAFEARKLYASLAVCFFLVLAVLIVFEQTRHYEFVGFDDDDYVYENPHVLQGLTSEGMIWAITAYHANNWHPLTWLSHMLDCELFGRNAGLHHLTNVLLHAAAVVLLFLTLERMTGTLWPSAWAAAVFAIHPLRVESVAWVSERKDVLSGVFFMLTLWFYARYVERPTSWGRYLPVVGAFAIGLTAKPMLVTLPFVLLLLDFWPLGRFGPRRVGGGFAQPTEPNRWVAQSLHPPYEDHMKLIIEKIPLFVLAAASCALTVAAQHNAMRTLEGLPLAARLAHASIVYVAYLGKMFFPDGLAVLYPLSKDAPPVWEVVGSAALLSAISAAALLTRRKHPYFLFGWLWYLGTLVPVIGIVQVGMQSMADRYTYLTQIGLYIAIAWGVADCASAWPNYRWAMATASALVVAALMWCASQQTEYWRNSLALWTRTLDCTTGNAIAHNDLGKALYDRNQTDAAIVQYQKAVDINPRYTNAEVNLAMALNRRGRVDEAITHYEHALEFNSNSFLANHNLGKAYYDRGRFDEAISNYEKALAIEPDNVAARNNIGLAHNLLGNELADRNQFDEAISHYRKALEFKPDNVGAVNNLGLALAKSGHVDQAIAQYEKALAIDPNSAETHINFGMLLAGRGELSQAREHYRKALDLAGARNDTKMSAYIQMLIGKLRQ